MMAAPEQQKAKTPMWRSTKRSMSFSDGEQDGFDHLFRLYLLLSDIFIFVHVTAVLFLEIVFLLLTHSAPGRYPIQPIPHLVLSVQYHAIMIRDQRQKQTQKHKDTPLGQCRHFGNIWSPKPSL